MESDTLQDPKLIKPIVDGSEVNSWLLKNGFEKYYGDEDYDCVRRVHVLHYLFWSDNLKHFFIAVINDTHKKTSAGGYKKWNSIIIPKPIYTVKEAKKLVESITS